MKLSSLLGRTGKTALIAAFVLTVLACHKADDVSNGTTNAASTENASAKPANPTPSVNVPEQTPEDKMPRVRVDEAKKLVTDGKAIIIDVRGTEAYKSAHIKGALDIPLTRLEAGDFKGLPRDKRIISYCT